MFLHPWAIVLGVAAASLPFVVHWLTKPRPVRLPISTLRFVREAVRQRRARHRLRDFIVLTLRTAAILLLSVAIARPLIGRAQSAHDDPDADRIRVVILDVSQSMGARVRGIENFERARPQAGQFLAYRSGLKANLILAGARPRATFEAASTNFGALRDALAGAAVRPERLNVQQALNLAADVFSRTPETDASRELVVISDFQRTNWAAADFSVLPEDTSIQLEAVVPEGAPANLAILGVRALGRVQAGQEARLAVEIGNYSPAPRTVRVEVSLGDAVYPVEGDCPPRSRTTLQAQFQVPTDGWRTGTARLIDVDDALEADNQRFWAVQSRPRPTIVILTREREDQRPSNSYYLERALVPDADSTLSGPDVVRVDAVDPDPETITRADVIVIVRSGRLSNETIHRVASLLRRGRGVLYVATDGVDSVNLQQFAEAAGPGLQLPVEFSPPPSGTPRTALFLTHVEQELPPFAVFGDRTTTAIAPLRFGGGLASRRIAGTLAEDVRAAFNDQSAFLVVTSSEAGKLAVLNADLAASDLPGSPLFVPLIAELMQQELLGREGATNDFASGEPFTLSLPAGGEGVASMQIAGDGADGEFGQLTQEAAGIVWQGSAAGPPGVYEVRQGNATVAAIVTTVPDEESDLRTLTADVLEERLAGGRQVTYRAADSVSANADDTAWSWLLVACVLCVIGEAATLRTFRT